MSGRDRQIAVVKIGGSILTGENACERAAKFVRHRLHGSVDRTVVVVSAQIGVTNALERAARRIVPTPATRAQDLLWATGELRSVAFLTLHLHALSVSAVGLNVHETGLKATGSDATANISFDSTAFEEAFGHHQVVVVPGFLATNSGGSIVSLGRGGSDLTAVLLAIHLNARRCELVKNVGGYFTEDPRVNSGAEHIRSLTYEQALGMADNGCELVQRQAIETASASNLPILIRGMADRSLQSVISSAPLDPELTVATATELSVQD